MAEFHANNSSQGALASRAKAMLLNALTVQFNDDQADEVLINSMRITVRNGLEHKEMLML